MPHDPQRRDLQEVSNRAQTRLCASSASLVSGSPERAALVRTRASSHGAATHLPGHSANETKGAQKPAKPFPGDENFFPPFYTIQACRPSHTFLGTPLGPIGAPVVTATPGNGQVGGFRSPGEHKLSSRHYLRITMTQNDIFKTFCDLKGSKLIIVLPLVTSI